MSVAILGLLAVLPVVSMFVRTADARRDIAYWDEYDTALSFVLKLEAGATPADFFRELVDVNNEHRLVVSRLLYATSYWLTGTLNFALLDVIGFLAIVAACGVLIFVAGTAVRRLLLSLLLGALVFQLEHYENFLWSGSSIDHFQIILLAAAACVALARHSAGGIAAAGFFATLATFTLAHGIALWPAGALALGLTRRHRHLLIWIALGSLVIAAYFLGFRLNDAQQFASFSLAGILKIARYWLAILGAVPALGFAAFAPWLGALLLLLLGYTVWRGAPRTEPVLFPLALFALLAAALIALGRAEHSGGLVFSRYYVLSAMAWALVLFMLFECTGVFREPRRAAAVLLPALLLFNLLANRQFADEVDSWLNCRDLAAVSYKHYGVDGRGPFRLHPNAERSTSLLRQAADRGVYHLGPICLPARFPRQARESNRIRYYVEEVTANASVAAVRGWAAIPDHSPKRGTTFLVLRSPETTHFFTTVTVPRSDVPAAMQQPGWTNSGFHFAKLRRDMPRGEFQVGILIKEGRRAEYIMTDHRLNLGESRWSASLASRG